MTVPPQPPPSDIPVPDSPDSPDSPEVGVPTSEAPARTRFATPPVAPPLTPPVSAPQPDAPAADEREPVEPLAAAEPEPEPEPEPDPEAVQPPVAAEPEPAPVQPAEPAEPAEPAAAGLSAEPDEPTPAVALPEPTPEPEPVRSTQAGPALEAPPLEPTPAPAPTRGKGLVAVLAAVVLVLAALTGFLAWRVHDTQGAGPVAASRTSALDASRSAARLVFSYDYRHLAKDFTAGRAVTTGQFRGEYDKTTAKLVADVAPRYKAVVVADVSDAAVVSATEDRVVTLVFLNQQSASSLVSTPKITQSRLEMTMVRKDGTWLVSKIKAL